MKLAALSLLLLAVLFCGRARADHLETYITVSCDSTSGQAMIRFAYADGGDIPTYQPIPDAPPSDLSRRDVPRPAHAAVFPDWYLQEASCALPGDDEAKARLGSDFLFADTAHRHSRQVFSVWFEKTKILSRVQTHLPICRGCLIHSILHDHATYRRCDFHLRENDSVYDLTHVPIQCSEPVPIKIDRDLVEYPLHGKAQIDVVGDIAIPFATNKPLCQSLIAGEANHYNVRGDVGPVFPIGNQLVTLQNVGGPLRDFRTPDEFSIESRRRADVVHGNLIVSIADVPLGGMETTRVYMVSQPYGRSVTVYLLTAPDTPEPTVIATIKNDVFGHGLAALLQDAAEKGWGTLSSEGTPYDNPVFFFFRYENVTYLLAYEEGADPTAVVYQTDPTGKLKLVCKFQQVRANF